MAQRCAGQAVPRSARAADRRGPLAPTRTATRTRAGPGAASVRHSAPPPDPSRAPDPARLPPPVSARAARDTSTGGCRFRRGVPDLDDTFPIPPPPPPLSCTGVCPRPHLRVRLGGAPAAAGRARPTPVGTGRLGRPARPAGSESWADPGRRPFDLPECRGCVCVCVCVCVCARARPARMHPHVARAGPALRVRSLSGGGGVGGSPFSSSYADEAATAAWWPRCGGAQRP